MLWSHLRVVWEASKERGCMQVILEEGGGDYGAAADYGANEFTFPGVQESEGYGEMEQMHEGPGAPSSVAYEQNPSLGAPAQPTSPRSGAAGGGATNPLSTATGPSQSLTGLLAGANDLLGEMGTTQNTAALTGNLTSSRNASFRQPKPPDSH
jgi:hypothetical protein